MRRLTVVMSQEERLALDEMARRDLRGPRECVRYLIRKAAVDYGLLPVAEEKPTAQEAANARATR